MFACIRDCMKAFGASRQLHLRDEGRVPPSVNVDWDPTHVTYRVCVCKRCDRRVRFAKRERTKTVVRYCAYCAEVCYPDQVKFVVLLPRRSPSFGGWFRRAKKAVNAPNLRCVK